MRRERVEGEATAYFIEDYILCFPHVRIEYFELHYKFGNLCRRI